MKLESSFCKKYLKPSKSLSARMVPFLIIANLIWVCPANAIDISGPVSGVWSPADNPYNVTGNITVPAESSLIIQPGCRVIFQGHYVFKVDSTSTLQAIGNQSDSIIFSAQDTIEGWRGIELFHAGSNTLFRYCTIEYCMNETTGVRVVRVSAINSSYSYLDIKNSTFNHCGRRTFAGAINSFYDSRAVVDSCLFINDTSGFGLVFVTTGKFTLTNSRFENNTGLSLIFNNGSDSVLIFNNIFKHNKSTIFVNNWGPRFNFTRNLVVDNSAIDGSDFFIVAIDGSTTMENNTISNNNTYGRVLITLGDEHSYPDMYFYNNIVWDNSVTGSMTFGDNMPLQATYNDIQGSWPGTGNISSNPKFVNPDSGDYHLSWANWPIDDTSKSPCIDTGDPSSPLDPDSTRADMGAFFYNQRWNDIDDNRIIPNKFLLINNYPNPFNSSSTIRYTVPTAGPVALDIYDILGRKVQTLLDINQPAGEYRVTWIADRTGSGVYYYRLTTDSRSVSKPMILLK